MLASGTATAYVFAMHPQGASLVTAGIDETDEIFRKKASDVLLDARPSGRWDVLRYRKGDSVSRSEMRLPTGLAVC
jgi:hypothetical protein